MDIANKPELLQEVKDKLSVTWDEQDKHIWRLTIAAIVYINSFGKVHDFGRVGTPKDLMLEHVFYNFNNALHEFYTAYSGQLANFSIDVAIGVYD